MFGYPFPVLVSENWTTVLDFAAPTVAVIVGLFIYFLKSRIDHRQWTNQKVIERRLDVIDRMSTKINAIYCYFTWIGRWKEHTPDKIVEMKRSLDDLFFPNEYLFTSDLKQSFKSFINEYFAHYTGANQDGKLKTSVVRFPDRPDRENRRTPFGEAWGKNWEETYFEKNQPSICEDIRTREKILKQRYEHLMTAFARELEIPEPRPRRRQRLLSPAARKQAHRRATERSAPPPVDDPISMHRSDRPLVKEVISLNDQEAIVEPLQKQ